MPSNLNKIASKLLKLADVCPLCGDERAENNKYHTKCPNLSCENYDVEFSLKVKTMDDAFGSDKKSFYPIGLLPNKQDKQGPRPEDVPIGTPEWWIE
jgi:hypothetical protein